MSDKYFILTKPGCPACVEAKVALTVRGIGYTEDIYQNQQDFERFQAAGHRTFPRVYLNGKLLGGNAELQAHLNPPDENDF